VNNNEFISQDYEELCAILEIMCLVLESPFPRTPLTHDEMATILELHQKAEVLAAKLVKCETLPAGVGEEDRQAAINFMTGSVKWINDLVKSMTEVGEA